MDMRTEASVHGYCRPEFEGLRRSLETQLDDLGAGGCGFTAYVDGELVVDLWAGFASPGVAWRQDTHSVLMSATKGIATLCVQVLVDRGLIDLDSPVASYWPDFAQAGKGTITVRQVLSHQAGLVAMPSHDELLHWDGQGWGDEPAILDALARSSPVWSPGSRHGYHAVTFGWLLSGLIRHVDGRSLGEFLRDEVCAPFALDLHIGVKPDLQPILAHTFDFMKDELPPQTRAAVDELFRVSRDPDTVSGQAFLAGNGVSALDKLASLMNEPRVRAAEFPSANGFGTARSLAAAYAVLAQRGTLNGITLLDPHSIDMFRKEQGHRVDEVLQRETRWAVGYMLNTTHPVLGKRLGPCMDAFGHTGAGGQLGMCDVDTHVSVGFVRNHLTLSPVLPVSLINSLYDALS